MKLLKHLLSKDAPKEEDDPKPGELWKMSSGEDTDGPWEVPEWKKCTVEILDVKDGWVRYKMGSIFFTDERAKVKHFKLIYHFFQKI